ncbi:MAG: HipA domain-containing protein [Oligoflexales bacterium]|nr:HipA domain-containing protein [Oligoflexales bacterium]
MKIEIRDEENWKVAGEIELRGTEKDGSQAACCLEYNMDYAEEKTKYQQTRGAFAFSCLFDVDFAFKETKKWPSFLLDLFPQGAALKYVVDHYRIADQPENYWKIINTAKLSPPGNVRISLPEEEPPRKHPGFDREEVIEKGPDFLEYMVACGAPISGTTGAAGAAPKFLLREDFSGKFHGEGVLTDSLTKNCWLVKYPRGDRKEKINRDILKAEKPWLDIAELVGLKTYKSLDWDKDCLFVPRFDRVPLSGGIQYLGMESFYSLVDSTHFGSRFRHKTYTDALYLYSDSKEEDLVEYLLRDIMNIALANNDNHGRNQSVLKNKNKVFLSPVYDFAPMKFDPEGIVRNTRWSENEENFLDEAALLYQKNYEIDSSLIKHQLEELWHKFLKIDLKGYDFEHDLITKLQKEIQTLDQKISRFIGNHQ